MATETKGSVLMLARPDEAGVNQRAQTAQRVQSQLLGLCDSRGGLQGPAVREHCRWHGGIGVVLHPKALDYVEGDPIAWEKEPLTQLAADGQLSAYKHEGFWQPVDTLRDLRSLQALWDGGRPPWKLWH